MSLYKRGKRPGVWWYEFWFSGMLIRESSKSESAGVSALRQALAIARSTMRPGRSGASCGSLASGDRLQTV